jgi:hypothetical protein
VIHGKGRGKGRNVNKLRSGKRSERSDRLVINVEAVMHVNGRQMEGMARDSTLDPRRHIQTPLNCTNFAL